MQNKIIICKFNNKKKSNRIDLIIDGGKPKTNKPSKVIDIRDINNIKIIRN